MESCSNLAGKNGSNLPGRRVDGWRASDLIAA
jgi:hypothetical protein